LPWGFEVAPIVQAGSARPYNSSTGISNILGFGSGPAAAHAIVPVDDPSNLTWANSLGSTTSAIAAAVQNCYFVTHTCRQADFNAIRGQNFFNLDTRVTKTIKFGEQTNLKLTFQMFDVTNRAIYGNNFDGNVRNATFKQPIGYVGCGGNVCNRNIPTSFRGEWGVQFTF